MYAKSDNKATCPKISLNFKQHVIFVSDSRLACLPWNERLRQRAAGSLEIGIIIIIIIRMNVIATL